jgi:hypothetical protein
MTASADMHEPELNLSFFASVLGPVRSTPMVNSGVAAMHVQLCPRNLSRELDSEQPARRLNSFGNQVGAVESGL